MKYTLTLGLALGLSSLALSQNVGINGTGAAPNASAMLDVVATDKGLLIPRVSLTSSTDAVTVPTPANWLLVFNTSNVSDVTQGMYYWDGAKWVKMIGASDAWLLTGNAGTTAGTNFIGTTDAQAFVTKTGGSAASNERFRILATGPGVFNATTPFAGDVFSVYGTGYTGATNALGAFAINGYVGAGGFGVYGESTSAAANDGSGVVGSLVGTSTATGTESYGVFGENFATPAGTGISVGTAGFNFGTSGDARGIDGLSNSPDGVGAAGVNLATTGDALGVYGETNSAAGIGVLGISAAAAYTTNISVGVFGRTLGSVTTGRSIAVRGYSDAATGNSHAFYGQALSSTAIGGLVFVTSTGAGWQGQNAGTGDGVRGFNTNPTATAAGDGIYGETNATTGFGGNFLNGNVLNGTGLLAVGNNTGGNYLTAGSGGAFNGTRTGALCYATQATNSTGVYGVSNGANILSTTGGAGVAGSSTFFGVAGFSTSSANFTLRAGGYFETNAGQSFAYVGARTAGGVIRKIEGNGTVNTTVKDLNDNLVVLSCPEAPENLFQDYGQGKLVNGFARIELDPILAKNIVVNEQHPLRVFIQLEGDCQGVYVTNKTGNSFEVKELNGGNSNVPFSWTITANRADEVLPDGTISKFSEERFAPAMGPQQTKIADSKVYNVDKSVQIEQPIEISSGSTFPRVTNYSRINKKNLKKTND